MWLHCSKQSCMAADYCYLYKYDGLCLGDTIWFNRRPYIYCLLIVYFLRIFVIPSVKIALPPYVLFALRFHEFLGGCLISYLVILFNF